MDLVRVDCVTVHVGTRPAVARQSPALGLRQSRWNVGPRTVQKCLRP